MGRERAIHVSGSSAASEVGGARPSHTVELIELTMTTAVAVGAPVPKTLAKIESREAANAPATLAALASREAVAEARTRPPAMPASAPEYAAL